MEPTKNEPNEFPIGKKIKLFLNNGFSYTGFIVKAGKLFLLIKDSKDAQLRNIAIAQIQQYQIMEVSQ